MPTLVTAFLGAGREPEQRHAAQQSQKEHTAAKWGDVSNVESGVKDSGDDKSNRSRCGPTRIGSGQMGDQDRNAEQSDGLPCVLLSRIGSGGNAAEVEGLSPRVVLINRSELAHA